MLGEDPADREEAGWRDGAWARLPKRSLLPLGLKSSDGSLLAELSLLSEEGGAVVSLRLNISPVPKSSQSTLMLGILALMASTVLRVGLVRLLKMLLSEAADMPMKLAKVC